MTKAHCCSERILKTIFAICVNVFLGVVVVVVIVVSVVNHVLVVRACFCILFLCARQVLVVVTAGNDLDRMTATDLAARVSSFVQWYADRDVRVVVLNVLPRSWDFITGAHRVK